MPSAKPFVISCVQNVTIFYNRSLSVRASFFIGSCFVWITRWYQSLKKPVARLASWTRISCCSMSSFTSDTLQGDWRPRICWSSSLSCISVFLSPAILPLPTQTPYGPFTLMKQFLYKSPSGFKTIFEKASAALF